MTFFIFQLAKVLLFDAEWGDPRSSYSINNNAYYDDFKSINSTYWKFSYFSSIPYKKKQTMYAVPLGTTLLLDRIMTLILVTSTSPQTPHLYQNWRNSVAAQRCNSAVNPTLVIAKPHLHSESETSQKWHQKQKT